MRWILVLFASASLGLAIVPDAARSARNDTRSVLRAVEAKPLDAVPKADVEGLEPEIAVEPGMPPTENGDCTLELWLRDSRTGEPIEATVRLYRLDLPADAVWSAGDDLQEQLTVPKTGGSISDLPAGRYRVDCALQRKAGTADAAFTVSGDRTRQIVYVETARTFDVWLTVTDPGGRRFSEGKRDRYTTFLQSWHDPSWVQTRESATGDSSKCLSIGGGCGSSRSTLQFGEGRFCVGRVTESQRRDESYATTFYWQPKDHTYVKIPQGFENTRDQEFHAIVIPLKRIYDAILLPDGSRAIDHNARIRGRTMASQVTDPNDRSAALREPIQVTARLRGYENLKFNVLANDSIFVRTMTPSK